MLSRRLMRIKVMQILYAYFKDNQPVADRYEKQLMFSVNKAYDLFHYLLLLLVELKDFANGKIEQAKSKRMPSNEDLNPNMKFVENKIFIKLQESSSFYRYINAKKISWANYPELIKKLFQDLSKTDFYIEYMNDSKRGLAADKKLFENIIDQMFADSEDLFAVIEDQSIYWNDDIEFVLSKIIQLVRSVKAKDEAEIVIPQKFNNEDDEQFYVKLFRSVTANHIQNTELINDFTQNWDKERIADIDSLILEMAIAECIYFPTIPTKVTFNEYIELSKFYSTKRSSGFINGILDNIIKRLNSENKIKKIGRGLIQN